MSSVPDGRAANHPLSAITFKPPMDAPLPGAWVRMVCIFSPARSPDWTCGGESFFNSAFSAAVAFSRIAAHPRRDLGRQQGRDDPVLVRSPDAAIHADERRSRALLPAEA